MGRIVGRWWNGKWGRTARKDIWLESLDEGRVLVRWRQRDQEWERTAVDLDHARLAAEMLREHGDPYDQWVDWTSLYVAEGRLP